MRFVGTCVKVPILVRAALLAGVWLLSVDMQDNDPLSPWDGDAVEENRDPMANAPLQPDSPRSEDSDILPRPISPAWPPEEARPPQPPLPPEPPLAPEPDW
ncbi:MAG TPA: hypothetical protein VN634_09880 [Candidatus Limnocylindrales bacterium]|nr:hypothetical protein [Candidatus Limnocylindrales bacterium]